MDDHFVHYLRSILDPVLKSSLLHAVTLIRPVHIVVSNLITQIIFLLGRASLGCSILIVITKGITDS